MLKKQSLQTIQNQIKNRQAQILDYEQFKKSAVLVPLIKLDDVWHVVFEVRSEHLRRQPGDICFPGGRIDPDDASPKEAAIRETSEELGIEKESIAVWGPLDYLVTPFKLVIYPFLGELRVNQESIKPNKAEVKEVFYVPLPFLLETTPEYYELKLYSEPQAGFPIHLIPRQENYRWRSGTVPEYFYFYEKYVIWGMTARILHHFLGFFKKQQQTR